MYQQTIASVRPDQPASQPSLNSSHTAFADKKEQP